LILLVGWVEFFTRPNTNADNPVVGSRKARPNLQVRALPAERLRHDFFAALAVVRIGNAGVATPRGAQPVRRQSAHAPAARTAGEARPVFGVVRDVGGLVDLLDLGGIFDHKAVRLDEIREYVVAWAVAADAPLDVEAIAPEAAGAAHQAVDV